MNIRKLPLLTAFLTLPMGCCERYVEPVGIPLEQLAIVHGAVEEIDHYCVNTGREIKVTPGAHVLQFADRGGIHFGPVTAMSAMGNAAGANTSVVMLVELLAGHRYEFTWNHYFDGSRLSLHNCTTQRKTFLDPMRYIFYDESDNVLPRPKGAYSP